MRKVLATTVVAVALAATPAHAQFWGSSPMWGYGGYGMEMGMGLIGGMIGGAIASRAMAAPPPPPPAVMAPPVAIQEQVEVARPYRCTNSRGWDERYGWVRRQYCR